MQTPELRRMSLNGIALMLFGLGLTFFELQTGFMGSRLGLGGRIVILVCGTAFSVWGLKNIIVSFLPNVAGRGMLFKLPKEGMLFLLITIVLLIGSLIGRNNLLMMVFCVMVSLFIINGKFTFTMLRLLRVSREVPERIMAGETFVVSMRLENRKSWLSAWMMLLRDEVTHSSGTLTPEVLFVRIPPTGQMNGHYQLRLRERGKYHFGPVSVSTRFPFGLVERGVGMDVDDDILVYPRIGQLHPNWQQKLQHSVELVSHLKPSIGPFNDEIHRLREYRPGDDIRTIHWKTTARMNELMVCEFQESRDRDLLLIVDAWGSRRPGDEELENFERALRFAATVCVEFLQSNRQSSLRVLLLGKEIGDWDGDLMEHQSWKLMDHFATLQSGTHDADSIAKEVNWDQMGQPRVLIVSTREASDRSQLVSELPLAKSDVHVFGASAAELSSIFLDDEPVELD